MKCNISKRSELVEFANDSEHRYIRGVFTLCVDAKKGLTRLAQLTMRDKGEYVVNIYPARNADGSIDDSSQAELDAIFEDLQQGKLDKEIFLVGKHRVNVPPFVMFDNEGNVRLQGNQPRIWDYINITTFNKVEDDVEVSVCEEGELQSRANAIRKYRIEQQDWMDAEDYFGDSAEVIEPDDEGIDPNAGATAEPQKEEIPSQPTAPRQPTRRR